jgi:hypothetical protein
MLESQCTDELPSFAVQSYFLETAFERRFQGLLRQACTSRSWQVMAAVPGSGKSLGLQDLVLQCASYKQTPAMTRLPMLALRAP